MIRYAVTTLTNNHYDTIESQYEVEDTDSSKLNFYEGKKVR